MSRPAAFAAALALMAAAPAGAAPALAAYFSGSASLPALRAEAGRLAIVPADQFAVDAQGQVHGAIPAPVRRTAAAHKISLLAVVSNYANGFRAAIATAILKPGPAQDTAAAGMLRAAQGLAGLNLDLEAVPHEERAEYSAFAARLAEALHARRQTLMLSVPAKTHEDPNDSWAGAYDYPALAQIADTLQVMTYDENGPWGKPGPVSGLDWMTACLRYTLSAVPPAQVSLGFPAYGYDWNLTKGGGTTVNWNQIPALLAATAAAPQWNAAASSPWFAYTGKQGDSHVVWYENARSIALKAALADTHATASISVWVLGAEDPRYWQAVAAGFGGARTAGGHG